ncbi:MAG TPA: transglycosylase domain-containing protein, partial [Gammaproteobacteria bacterium]|nr:transglycosylase domain-containing protein [Gammaproteobacteria bacterium]
MPRGKKKLPATKPSLPKIAFLLLQYGLIKVGEIPVLLLKLIVNSVKKLYHSVPRYSVSLPKAPSIKLPKPQKPSLPTFELKLPSLPKFSWPSFSFPSFHFSMPHLPRLRHRRVGRPRKSWFLPRFISGLRLKVRRAVPPKARFAVLTAIVLILLYQYTYVIFTTASQLPNPNKLVSSNTPLTTEFYDRNGKLLYRLYEGRNRTLVRLNELPSYLTKATLAAEDKNFYSHPGVDFVAIVRAFIANTVNHPRNNQLEGASTITQQLIKNTLLTPE